MIRRSTAIGRNSQITGNCLDAVPLTGGDGHRGGFQRKVRPAVPVRAVDDDHVGGNPARSASTSGILVSDAVPVVSCAP